MAQPLMLRERQWRTLSSGDSNHIIQGCLSVHGSTLLFLPYAMIAGSRKRLFVQYSLRHKVQRGGRCLGSGRRASAPIVSFMRLMVRLQFHTNKDSLLNGFNQSIETFERHSQFLLVPPPARPPDTECLSSLQRWHPSSSFLALQSPSTFLLRVVCRRGNGYASCHRHKTFFCPYRALSSHLLQRSPSGR